MPYSLNGVYPSPEGDDGLQVLSEDSDRRFCRAWHLGTNGDPRSVLVVLPAAEHPAPTILDRLAHEYSLRDDLDAAWAARPFELLSEDGRRMLLLEDPGGEPLEPLLSGPIEVGRFLRIAIGISSALSGVHRRDLIHKDIKPANILVNCVDGQVRLTGFGITSLLPRERQLPDPPETIAGTLAYMAPEQTGRMNRWINSRSDLYALGATFYAKWSWDLDRIEAKGYTDNVVDLMVGKLTRVPVETQKALRLLACLGNIAEISMLSIVLEMSEDQVHAVLWPAVRQDLIERQAGAYRFVHDRVQEAAYSTIPDEIRAATHLRIGRLLVLTRLPKNRRRRSSRSSINSTGRRVDHLTRRTRATCRAQPDCGPAREGVDGARVSAELSHCRWGSFAGRFLGTSA